MIWSAIDPKLGEREIPQRDTTETEIWSAIDHFERERNRDLYCALIPHRERHTQRDTQRNGVQMILLREGSGGSAFDPFGKERERERWSANDPFERGIWRECIRSFGGRERDRERERKKNLD
jgi:hypothetical protein